MSGMTAQWGHRGLDTTNSFSYSKCNTCHVCLTCTPTRAHSLHTGATQRSECIFLVTVRVCNCHIVEFPLLPSWQYDIGNQW